MIEIKPHPGTQVRALQSTAKVVLFGGAKGGGKSFALRAAPCYYLDNLHYYAVIFRRSLPQVKKPGVCGIRVTRFTLRLVLILVFLS